MIKIKSNGAETTKKIGFRIGELLKKGDAVFLLGDIGAGKTVFMSGIAEAFGISEPITSPTYTLCNIYSGKYTICHFDLYRIEDPDEIPDIGFLDAMNEEQVVVAEWSERALEYYPEAYIEVSICRTAEFNDCREIVFQFIGKRYSAYEDSCSRHIL